MPLQVTDNAAPWETGTPHPHTIGHTEGVVQVILPANEPIREPTQEEIFAAISERLALRFPMISYLVRCQYQPARLGKFEQSGFPEIPTAHYFKFCGLAYRVN